MCSSPRGLRGRWLSATPPPATRSLRSATTVPAPKYSRKSTEANRNDAYVTVPSGTFFSTEQTRRVRCGYGPCLPVGRPLGGERRNLWRRHLRGYHVRGVRRYRVECRQQDRDFSYLVSDGIVWDGGGIPVLGSTQYTASVLVKSVDEGADWRFFVEGYTAAGASDGVQGTGAYATCPVGSLTLVSVTFTTDSTCRFIRVNMNVDGAVSTTDLEWLFGSMCLREGSSTVFIPSLDIQASPTYTKDPAGIAAAYASSLLKVGDGWAGDAVKVELQDGVAARRGCVRRRRPDDGRRHGHMDRLCDGSEWTVIGSGAVLGIVASSTSPNPARSSSQDNMARLDEARTVADTVAAHVGDHNALHRKANYVFRRERLRRDR